MNPIDFKNIAAMIAIGTYAGTVNSSNPSQGAVQVAARMAEDAADKFVPKSRGGGKKSKRRKLKRRKSKRRKSKRRRTKRR